MKMKLKTPIFSTATAFSPLPPPPATSWAFARNSCSPASGRCRKRSCSSSRGNPSVIAWASEAAGIESRKPSIASTPASTSIATTAETVRGTRQRPRDREARQDQVGEHAVAGMQEDVGEVVAARVEPPELELGPERGEREWIVLRHRARFGPDAPEAVERTQRVVGRDVVVVVPDEPGAQHRGVGDQSDRRERGRNEPRRPRARVRQWRSWPSVGFGPVKGILRSSRSTSAARLRTSGSVVERFTLRTKSSARWYM